MKKSRELKAGLFNLLVVIAVLTGIGLLLYPTVSNWLNEKNASKAIADYSQAVEALDTVDIQKMLEEARAYNQSLVGNTSRFEPTEEDSARYHSILDVSGTGIMGYVEIPSIGVKLPIYHGTEDSVLQVAAGHIEGSSLPVGGENTHVAISGHCGLPSAKLFTKLDTLKVGDEFNLSVLGKTLNYKVDDIVIVLPDDFSPLSIEGGEDQVTLITCTPYGVNSHRLMVRGTRA